MSENVVEMRNLTRRFGKKVALDDISLSVARGMVLGLVGENGAGKTTMIKHILGLFKPQAGKVEVFGLDPIRDPVNTLGRIGYLSEERDLPEWMRVGELMNYTHAFYPKWDISYAAELRKKFDLDPNQKIKTLSKGQRARAALLIAEAHRPDLLLLDEPSSGLDPVVRRDILSAIVLTVASEGRTVLFSSHLLDEVERVADTVAIIHCGKINLLDSLDRIKETHHWLTLRFAEPQREAPVFPGALSAVGGPLEWSFLCDGDIAFLRSTAEALGANVVEHNAPTLDEIFVTRIKG